MNHTRRIAAVTAAALITLMIGAAPADARPEPDPTNFTEMAKTYHCGPYFHGTKVRGLLVPTPGRPLQFVHVSADQPRLVSWPCQL